jgi:rare lipoprotein A (peptidoglycan hydrolase)
MRRAGGSAIVTLATVIDVSRRAEALGFIRQGQARVRLDVLRWGNR